MQPIILSARKAKKDIERIKGLHSTLLEGMAQHQMKVQQYNAEQSMLKRDQDMQNNEMISQDKDRELKSTEMQNNTQKESMNYALKTKELEIKRAALTQTE